MSLSNSKHLFFATFLMVVVLTSCSAQAVATGLEKNDTSSKKYILLADPTIFFDKGSYYLYGTGAGEFSNGFAVYKSSDLKTWKGPMGVNEGYAFKKGDAYGDAKFWAPQVFKHENKFYLAYAASEHIAIATSNEPAGPFKQTVSKPLSEESKQIDPYIFIDDNSKQYLYYVVVANGANRIFVAEMNDDRLSVKKGTAKQCIEATDLWENTAADKWSVTEGPTVIKHNGTYYLIYSANHFKYPDYAVGYATSKSPLGPWQKYEGNPIVHKSITGQNGSGHGDLFKSRNNNLMYVFHTHNSANKIAPRKTAIIEMEFVKDKKTNIDKLLAKPETFNYLYK